MWRISTTRISSSRVHGGIPNSHRDRLQRRIFASVALRRQCRVVMLHFTTQSSNRPRNLSYELPDGTSSLLAPNVSTRKLCSSQDASGIHDNSSFMKRDVDSCNALCADVVLSSSTTCSKGIFEHVPRILSARSCVLVGVLFRELF